MTLATRLALPFALMSALATLAVSAADRRETRAATGFTAIALAAPVKVDVVQGDTEGLAVEGDELAVADLETIVERGTLKIRTRSKREVPGMHKVRVHVNAKALEALRIAGSGDIVVPALRSPELKISVSGSGDVRIAELDATRLEVSVAGSGDVLVGGKADTLSTSIAGSGDVKAGKLAARSAKVSIAGSGDVTLWARETLTVSVVGSGGVRFYGDPEVKRTIMGSGSVRRLGATPS
jgi:hypothetical protein